MAWAAALSGQNASFSAKKRSMQTPPPPITRPHSSEDLKEGDGDPSTGASSSAATPTGASSSAATPRIAMPGLMANIGVSQLTGDNVDHAFQTIHENTKKFLSVTQGQSKFKAAVLKASIIERLKTSREGGPGRSRVGTPQYNMEVIHRSLFARLGQDGGELTALDRFRRLSKVVSIIQMAMQSTRRENEKREAKYLSFSQLQDEALSSKVGSYGPDGLDFDLSYFKASKEQYISSEAKQIMKMDPHRRSPEQLHIALVSLNQAVEAFGEFPIKMQSDLVSRGWYEKFEAKRVIIRQGHYADNFYFILSGVAIVTILQTHKDTGEQFMNTVAFLKKGNSFGELALMYGGTRNATITCKNDVELLAVNRDTFVDIFMHVDIDVEPDHIRFVRTVPVFDGWPISLLPYSDPKICLFTFFRRGVVMCRDSNKNEWIYIVKTGTCRVLKLLNRATPNMPILRQMATDLKATTNHIDPELRVRQNEDHQTIIERIYDLKHPKANGGLYPHGPGQKGDKQDKCFAELQKLGPKEIFGLVPIAFQLMEMEMMSLTLVSDGAECVLINKKFFIQHLTDEHRKFLRKTIQPYPTEQSVQQKFQDKVNWEAYKRLTFNKELIHSQKLHDIFLH